MNLYVCQNNIDCFIKAFLIDFLYRGYVGYRMLLVRQCLILKKGCKKPSGWIKIQHWVTNFNFEMKRKLNENNHFDQQSPMTERIGKVTTIKKGLECIKGMAWINVLTDLYLQHFQVNIKYSHEKELRMKKKFTNWSIESNTQS